MAQQQRSEETQAQILQAAGQLFAREGYDSASVADICRLAGVSKGAFYHHFQSKHALFLELMEEWMAEQEQALGEIRKQAANVPEALLAMSIVAREVFDLASRNIPIFLQFINRAGEDSVRRALDRYLRRYRNFFAALIEAGIAEGSLRSVDLQQAVYAALSMSLGALLQAVVAVEERDWAQVSQDAMRLLLQGLEARASSG
ncbi:MAG: TetR/AcrR family transcriptional regulator [Chloroflexia bacterium]|nr:TetR/AcrR family transcriptional regulator [Chloroflexia bacterium]